MNKFKCDICGRIKTSNVYPVFDENWNKLQGLKMCEDCFKSEINDENK